MLKTISSIVNFILGLPSATTPLSGSELVAVSQSGTAKSVSVANLTSGRTPSMSGINIEAAVQGAASTIGTDVSFFMPGDGVAKYVYPTNWFNGLPRQGGAYRIRADGAGSNFGLDLGVCSNDTAIASGFIDLVTVTNATPLKVNVAGSGLTLTSPNGLVTKTVTIDNAGNIALI